MSFRPASGTLTQGPVPLEGERRAISARAQSIGCSLTPRDRFIRPKHNMHRNTGPSSFRSVSEEFLLRHCVLFLSSVGVVVC